MPVIVLSVFVTPLAITGTAVTIPRVAVELGSDPVQLQWIVNGFNVSFALFTLVWGVISDRIGYQATVIAGNVLGIAAGALSAFAPTLFVLDLGRVLAGVAGAAVFTGASALLSNAYGESARTRNFAIFGTTIGLGSALGPTLSGVLTGWFDWRGVFVAFGVVALLATVFSGVLPNPRHEHVPGRKIVDFSLLRNPHFLAMCLVPVAAGIGTVTLVTYLPVAFGAIYGLSAPVAGLFMLACTIPVLICPILVSRVMHRYPRVTAMTVIYAALIVLVIGDIGMQLVGVVPALWNIPFMILVGAGFGLTIGLVDAEALAAVAPHRAGAAAGVLNFVRLGSEAIVIAAFAAALAWQVGLRIPDPQLAQDVAAGAPGHGDTYAAGYHIVLIAVAVLVAVAGVAILLLHRARLRGERSAEQRTEAVATCAAQP